jgi:hypothetical protein
MRRTPLIRGLAAALALGSTVPVAHAVMLDPRGLGQALVFPYYTVNAGQDTLLTIVNTSNVGKAVKVTFREGYNGRETLTFDLFLSAHDSWIGAVSSIDGSAEGGARLTSPDHSCISGAAYPAAFRTSQFDGSGTPPSPVDGGPTTPARTREGMLEVITLGDIAPGSPTDVAITPVQTGQPDAGTPPCNLPVSIVGDLVAPTSGITGSSAIANVGEGTFYTYIADALSGFAFAPLRGHASGPDDPNLGSARSQASPSGGAIATVFDASGEPIQIDYARGIDAVSAVFMADSISNDYLIVDALGADTDWVVTFPTKQFYVDKDIHPSDITGPFAQPFNAGHSRLEIPADVYGRESASGWPPPRSCDLVPACATHAAFPAYQVSILALLPPDVATSGVFASKLATSPLSYVGSGDSVPPSDSAWISTSDGWLKLDLAGGDRGAHTLVGGKTLEGADLALIGLPVTGFMAYNIINSQAAPGRLANYGGTFRHRSHWSCTGAAEICE